MNLPPPPPIPDRRPSHKTFGGDFRRFFVRGLAVLLPSVLTLWILVQAYHFVDARVAEPINAGIRQGVLWIVPRTVPEGSLPDWFVISNEETAAFRAALKGQGTPEAQALVGLSDPELKRILQQRELRQYWEGHPFFRFIGLIVAIVLIYLAGVALGGLLGRSIYARIESFLVRIPLIRQIYPHVKQLVDLVFGERQIAFRQAVLIEFPRKGTWSLGFVTGPGLPAAAAIEGEEVLAVFIPHSPAPISGFVMAVRKSEVIELAISIDEALRYVLTAGVLVPAGLAAAGLKTAGAIPRDAGGTAGYAGAVGGAEAPLPPAPAGAR